jgi:hypothetical protein
VNVNQANQTIPDPSSSLQFIFNKYFKLHRDKALEELASIHNLSEEDQADYLFKAEARAVTKYYNSLNGMKKHIETSYSRQLWTKGEYYPKQWMINDTKIFQTLTKFRIIDVLNFLDTSNVDPKGKDFGKLVKGKKYESISKSGAKEGKQVKYDYSIILVNKEFYQKIRDEIGLGTSAIQKYLKAFCDIGILLKLGKAGKDNREMLYADGYYVKWEDGKNRKIRFLTAKMKSGLQGFVLT